MGDRGSEDDEMPTTLWKESGGERKHRVKKESRKKNKKCRKGRQRQMEMDNEGEIQQRD